MVRLWGESTIKSDFNPNINQVMPGLTFSKEKKFFIRCDDKNKTKAMFYASDAEPGYDTNPDKIQAFTIPVAGIGFSTRPTGDKIDNS